MNLGFLASHRGSNMQAIIDACLSGRIAARPLVVISNNPDSYSLERGKMSGLNCYYLNSKVAGGEEELDKAICEVLLRHEIDLVILAGYMRKIGPHVLQQFKGHIINVHPALLPHHGGKGMYGQNVHAAVLKAREKETGASIHLVDEEYDRGPVLAQAKVAVEPTDTVESLAERVLKIEHKLYVDTVAKIVNGEIKLAK